MVLLDTNIFVIDRFFRQDPRYNVNRAFLATLPSLEAGFYILSLFELCGISSFNLAPAELKRWMFLFDEVYSLTILDPPGVQDGPAEEWFGRLGLAIFERIERKMTWGDAVLLQAAEAYGADAVITWNKRHFEDRTTIRVSTPEEFLATNSTALGPTA